MASGLNGTHKRASVEHGAIPQAALWAAREAGEFVLSHLPMSYPAGLPYSPASHMQEETH